MCGFTGFILPKHHTFQQLLEQTIQTMTQTLKSRGPDDGGVWCDPKAGIALGHRRLAILDLSPLGHQPMISPSGRFILVYNGEVYNFKTLREQLQKQGISFKGDSDTEVLLAGFEVWGIKKTIQSAVGMFALALWDKKRHTLTLVRDRLGIKPLYWGWIKGTLFFGSQLKSFFPHPHWRGVIDRTVLNQYLHHGRIASPTSIFKNIAQLKAGHILTINEKHQSQSTPYWSLGQITHQPRWPKQDMIGAKKALKSKIKQAITQRMVADVPLGAFLSGGVDSSLVVALMQSVSHQPIQTFSIGFEEKGYDESRFAKEVAKHLHTDHTTWKVSAKDAQNVIEKLPEIYDEPFADSSQIPTYLVSLLARKSVTVALSGDGGDENFAGYYRHMIAPGVEKLFQKTPNLLRRLAEKGILLRSPQQWNQLFNRLRLTKWRQPGDKLFKMARLLRAQDETQIYHQITTLWPESTSPILEEDFSPAPTDSSTLSLLDQFRLLDMQGYLADDILTKVDRASMSVGLEARVPLLDHRVIKLAWQLPQDFLLHQGQGKWLLRQILYDYVPTSLIERPKTGFAIPLDQWLRGDLKDWAEDLLSENGLKQEGYFHAETIRKLWKEHQSAEQNHQHALWSVLMFQAWKRYWKIA
ncbi:asparagine synthase (glutamine-hydrolyzing) [Magnetococcales bacterium HHB-1]